MTSIRQTLAQHTSLISQAFSQVMSDFAVMTVPVERGSAEKVYLRELPWNDRIRDKAETARWGGGSASASLIEGGRRHIKAWEVETLQPFHFERHSFAVIEHLAAAWRHTGEPDYAVAATDYLRGFVTAHPNGECGGAHPGFGIRQLQWLTFMPYFFDHESLDDGLIDQVIATVRRSLNEAILPRLQPSGNIRIFQADALMWCGMRLRHINEAELWIRTGVRLYNDAFVRQVEADGSSCEHDPHYHGVPCPLFFEALRWSRAFPELGLKISIDGVDRLFTYWCATNKPNGRECGIGDGSTDWQGLVVDENMASRTVFRREFGLPDEPPATSSYFPDAGHGFFRSDWTPSATYVTFDATRWFGAHNHLSRNSITLHAHGRSLLIDSGSLTYHFAHAATINPQPMNELAGPYGKSTRAHNTLSLNGWNQWTVNPDQTRHWHAPGIDVMFSRYSGGYWSGSYGWWFSQGGGVGIPAVHDRIMIWLRDRCVVVIDTMMRWNEVQDGVIEAVRSPALEMNWQFSPGDVLIDAASKRVTTSHPDGNVLMLFPHLPPNAQFALHHGSTEPFRGWIATAGRNHTYIPSPQLCISCTPWTEFMGGLVSVLVPYYGSEAPSVTASVTGPITQGNFAVTSSPSHLVLTWGDGSTDKVTWMPALDSMLTQGQLDAQVATDASLLLIRQDGRGDVIAGAVVNGTWCSHFTDESLNRSGALSWGLSP